jgi:hypothetical protein
MEEITKPTRRWFRFSLRTMLVLVTLVAIIAGWVGQQLNWIGQRREFLLNQEITENHNRFMMTKIRYRKESRFPLYLFGERAVDSLFKEDMTQEDFDHACYLFSEASAVGRTYWNGARWEMEFRYNDNDPRDPSVPFVY